MLILPILIPLNYTKGKTAVLRVSGLDTFRWSNNELAFYVLTRQHLLYAALCTVLIKSILDDWMSKEALISYLEIFLGAVTAISFNRDYNLISWLKRSKKLNLTKRPRNLSYRLYSLLNLFNWLVALEKFPLLRSAFVTFANLLAANMRDRTIRTFLSNTLIIATATAYVILLSWVNELPESFLVSLSAGLTTIANKITNRASLAGTLAKNLLKVSNYFLANSLLRFNRLIGNFGTFVPVFTNLSCIGLFYPKVCLIALFLLACIMLLATGLTMIYYRLLCRVFNPLLSFSPTALDENLAKETIPSPPFLHKALTLILVVRILGDGYGISSARALQLREELKGVAISNTDATITASGKIFLN
ncbi:hypothetical protein PSV08DRAFT_375477 [Bipolaris maydis]|uniref:uncharacterized protein n=1 Tax=Cochliobolus heterostrophus TaxID=5016 RepID=UPI0024D215E2|nr:hypothetical protein PSV08DRAFT_375477 [Bipolaris maydis]